MKAPSDKGIKSNELASRAYRAEEEDDHTKSIVGWSGKTAAESAHRGHGDIAIWLDRAQHVAAVAEAEVANLPLSDLRPEEAALIGLGRGRGYAVDPRIITLSIPAMALVVKQIVPYWDTEDLDNSVSRLRSEMENGLVPFFGFSKGKFSWPIHIALMYYARTSSVSRSGDSIVGELAPRALQDELKESKSNSTSIPPMPSEPPAKWPGRPRGGQAKGGLTLEEFIRATYGYLMNAHRDELREFIFRNDRKLYDAIVNYERTRKLPDDISMPSRRDLVLRGCIGRQQMGWKGCPDPSDARSPANCCGK